MENCCSTTTLDVRNRTSLGPRTFLCLLGLLASYLLFFVTPVFLNSEHRMLSESGVPIWHEVGSDIKRYLTFSEAWLKGNSPYAGMNIYPPLASIIFVPLLWVDFSTAYFIVTSLTILAYLLAVFLIPLKILRNNDNDALPILVLFSVTGAVSYGFQFELEQGQFNMIIFSLSLSAIYFHFYHKRFWFLSYFLITLAIQLKIYPLIFLFMIAGDWRNWRASLARLLTILLVNFACLFVLGPGVFCDFVAAIRDTVVNPPVLPTNHSIASFAGLFPKYGERFLPMIPANYLVSLYWFFYILLSALFLLCFAAIWWKSWKNHQYGIDPVLFLGCVLAACLIPSESNDYKLPLLISPVLLFSATLETSGSLSAKSLKLFVGFIIALTYFSTLYSGTHKPLFLSSNCPILIILAVVATSYIFLREKISSGI
jgi:hypothetical protein